MIGIVYCRVCAGAWNVWSSRTYTGHALDMYLVIHSNLNLKCKTNSCLLILNSCTTQNRNCHLKSKWHFPNHHRHYSNQLTKSNSHTQFQSNQRYHIQKSLPRKIHHMPHATMPTIRSQHLPTTQSSIQFNIHFF